MIDKQKIEDFIREKVSETDVFIVDISVKPGNLIQVYLDQPEGISLDTCVEFSRLIESNLDRETEDFELQVSSAGLTLPLKVPQQYLKNLGNSLKASTLDGEDYVGLIKIVDDEGVELDVEVSVKAPGAKRKKIEIKSIRLEYKDIKTAKINLKF